MVLFPFGSQSSARLLAAAVFALALIEQVDVSLANKPSNIDIFLTVESKRAATLTSKYSAK